MNLRLPLLVPSLVLLSLPCAFAAVESIPQHTSEFESAVEQGEQINEYFDAAFNAFVDADYDRAIAYFNRVLQINAKDKTAKRGIKQAEEKIKAKKKSGGQSFKENFNLIKRYVRKGKWLDAMNELHLLIVEAPQNAEILAVKNDLQTTFRQKMTMQQIGSSQHLFYQGLLYYLDRQYDKASESLEEASAKDPNDFQMVVYFERAKQMFRESARYEAVIVGKKRAEAAFTDGNYDAAVQLWKQYLEFEPKDEEVRTKISNAEGMLWKEKRRNAVSSHYDKGLTYFLKGDYISSAKEWLIMLEIDPMNEIASQYLKRIKDKGVSIDGISAPTESELEAAEAVEAAAQAANTAMAPEEKIPAAEPPAPVPQEPQVPPPSGEAPPSTAAEAPPAGPDDTPEGRRKKLDLIGSHYDTGLSMFLKGDYKNSLKEWQAILAIDSGNDVAKQYVEKIAKKGIKAEPEAVKTPETKTAPVPQSPASAVPETASIPPSGGTAPLSPPAATPTSAETVPPSVTAAPVEQKKPEAEPAAPPEPLNGIEQGIDLFKDKKYRQALEFFEIHMSQFPDDKDGQVWHEKVREAEKKRREEAQGRYNKGVIAYSEGNVKKAVKEWKEALSVYPDHIASQRALARVNKKD